MEFGFKTPPASDCLEHAVDRFICDDVMGSRFTVKMMVRRRRQLMFLVCLVLWLSVLSSLQYLITSALVEHGTLRFALHAIYSIPAETH